ncbi:hypothetical protein M1D69_19195 [Bacillus sp. PK3-037]
MPIQDLAVIDPHEQPLECWKRNTARIRMNDLRSPSVHHMDTEPFSLQTYADKSQWPEVFFGRYKRPSLSLLNERCETVLDEIHIDQAWKTGMVTDLRRKKRIVGSEGRCLRNNHRRKSCTSHEFFTTALLAGVGSAISE